MAQDRTRKIVVTGVLSAIAILLGLTRIGFIPWLSGASLTIMHVPAIIGAILEGPIVGLGIGLIFGIFSMIQAAVAPNGPADVWFTNPLLAILPRLIIGPAAWLVWRALKKWPVVGLITAGLTGSIVNTVGVLGMIGLLKFLPWAAIIPIATANGVPEAILSAILTLIVVGTWLRISTGKKQGADL